MINYFFNFGLIQTGQYSHVLNQEGLNTELTSVFVILLSVNRFVLEKRNEKK